MSYYNAIETQQVGAYTVKVVLDEHGGDSSPREWAPLGTFWTQLPRYNSPDKFSGDIWESLAWQFDIYAKPERDSNGRFMCYDVRESDPSVILNRVSKLAVILPVYIYDHSGVAYSASDSGNPFSCQWDSGCAGFIFISLADIRKEYGVKRVSKQLRDKVAGYLKGEVTTYSDWANGNIYSFEVEDSDGENVESCFGFIGDSDYCLSEGVDVAKAIIHNDRMNRFARLKELIRNRVPLGLRSAQLVGN